MYTFYCFFKSLLALSTVLLFSHSLKILYNGILFFFNMEFICPLFLIFNLVLYKIQPFWTFFVFFSFFHFLKYFYVYGKCISRRLSDKLSVIFLKEIALVN